MYCLAIGFKHDEQRSTSYTLLHLSILDRNSKLLVLESKIKRKLSVNAYFKNSCVIYKLCIVNVHYSTNRIIYRPVFLLKL